MVVVYHTGFESINFYGMPRMKNTIIGMLQMASAWLQYAEVKYKLSFYKILINGTRV